MKKECPVCKKDKEGVGPKIVGKAKSSDPRLRSENDALSTKIMCRDCYESIDRIQKCLNPNCNATLYITGRIVPNTDIIGVDREIKTKRDEKGEFLECLKCGSKHSVLMWQGPPGTGGRWRIDRLRE